MYSKALEIAAIGLVGGLFAAPVQAGGGVTLSDPNAAPPPRRMGVTLASGQPAERRSREIPAGKVLFSVQDADLMTEILPLIEEQAGVSIRYRGKPRSVSLRLVEPIGWEEAIELVNRFTKTHLTRDYQGRFVLKSKYGGEPDEESSGFDDVDGQVEPPERFVLAAAKRAAATAARQAAYTPAPPPKQDFVTLGNPRPVIRMGPFNARVGTTKPARPFVAIPQGPRAIRRPTVRRANQRPRRPFVAQAQRRPSQRPAKVGASRDNRPRLTPRQTNRRAPLTGPRKKPGPQHRTQARKPQPRF